MDQFNIDITCNDFDVKPVVIGDDFAIFVGVRPLSFHFVVIQNQVSDEFRYNSNYQFHLHKFDVANEFLELKNRGKNNNEKERIRNKKRDTLQLSLDPEMNYWIATDFLGFEVKIEPETGQWFLDELENEAKRVEAAIAYLAEKKNQAELLRRLKLPKEGAYDFTRKVWMCMQFEKDTLAAYKKKVTGIFSLYPKVLKGDILFTDNDLESMVYTLETIDPLCTCEFCMENAGMFDGAHTFYFPQEIYICGQQQFSRDKIREGTRLMFSKLDPVDQLALTYLDDSSPMPLVTLSYFCGLRTEQSLIGLVCTPFQPDSKEEQKVREQVSLISWFRKIA